MKMEHQMKNRLNIRIKSSNNGEPILDTNKRKKLKTVAFIKVSTRQKAYLKTVRDYYRGFFNLLGDKNEK